MFLGRSEWTGLSMVGGELVQVELEVFSRVASDQEYLDPLGVEADLEYGSNTHESWSPPRCHSGLLSQDLELSG